MGNRLMGPLTGPAVGRVCWTVLIAATLWVCYFSRLGTMGFVGPDEPRYAWIARAMVESGDWVTPRLYGRPWFEKPALYYWEAGLSFKILGVTEAAARLPSAISALLGTLALAWLAWRVYGARTARWLLVLLPSCVGMIGFSHAAATDMPFTAMLTMAMVSAAVALGLTRNEHTPILPRTPWLALALFGAFLGLAVLAKGPVALVLCGGAIFFWGIFTKRWREVFRLLHPVAVIAFCAAALPWYVLCARRNPEFFHVFIVEHNFKRYLTPEFQHIQPFWFYAPVLLVALLPWTAMLLWVSVAGVREFIRRRRVSEATGLLICWAGFCAVFFSASHSKLPGYILPAIPAIGLLMTHVYVSMGDRLHRSFRAAHLAAAAILFGGLGVAELLTRNSSHVHAISVGAAGMVIALWAVANLIMGWFAGAASNKNSLGEFWAALSVAPILVAMLSAGQLLPRFFHGDPSGRSIAREVQRQRIPMKALAVSGMNRAQEYSLSFYLHEEIKDWNPSSETGGYLLTAAQNCEAVVGARFYCELERFESEGTGRFLYLVIPIAGEK